jgi:hypothetical protein
MRVTSAPHVSAHATQAPAQQNQVKNTAPGNLNSGQVPNAQSAAQSGNLADSFNPSVSVNKNKGAKNKVSAEAQHRRDTWRMRPWGFPER